MKKIFLLIAAPFALFTALLAQVTQEEADSIVLNRMSQETQSHIIYAKEGIQTGITITTAAEEELELDYPCWVYFINYTDVVRYLIVNGSNGNLLEVNPKNGAEPNDLAEWRIVPIEIPFEDYLLKGTSCVWKNLIYKDNLVIINSNEELEQYICMGGGLLGDCIASCVDYSTIDFLKYTLLVTSGSCSSGIQKITKQLINTAENKYNFNIDITLNFTTATPKWVVTILISKISQHVAVSLNVDRHY